MPAHRPPKLQIETDDTSAALVVRLSGELDAGTVDQLERALSAVLEPRPVVVLDLHELTFVDSLGLNVLFRTREWADAKGVTLRAVRAPVHVQRLLALSALDGSLGPFYTDAAAALRG
jgi:stage II sporulation protein AA (anti-sigma F factor antagonist)